MGNIQLIDLNNQQIIETYTMAQEDLAFARASELENLGMNVKLIIPNVTDTLASELGLNVTQKKQYFESLTEEIDDHDGVESVDSCCFKKST